MGGRDRKAGAPIGDAKLGMPNGVVDTMSNVHTLFLIFTGFFFESIQYVNISLQIKLDDEVGV